MMVSSSGKDKYVMRISNKTRTGEPFDHDTIRSVWDKATKQPGFETFSLDYLGSYINMFEYGRRSLYGWVIQRIVPLKRGGNDEISNLRPLHWKHLPNDHNVSCDDPV